MPSQHLQKSKQERPLDRNQQQPRPIQETQQKSATTKTNTKITNGRLYRSIQAKPWDCIIFPQRRVFGHSSPAKIGRTRKSLIRDPPAIQLY